MEEINKDNGLGSFLDKVLENEGVTEALASEQLSPAAELSAAAAASTQVAPLATSKEESDDYIIAKDGDREIRLPKSAKVSLSTKAGDAMELSVGDWANAPWSQRENAKLVNDKNQLQKTLADLTNRYGDLDSLLNADPNDIKGKDWATQVIKSVYNMRPERGEDLKEFFMAIQNGTLSNQDLKQAELQRENLQLKNKGKYVDAQVSQAELQQYSTHLCDRIIKDTGIPPEELGKVLQELNSKGELIQVKNKQDLDTQSSYVYGKILLSKADKAIKSLGLKDEEVVKHSQDITGLLYGNPGQSVEELTKKLGAIVGRSPAAKAKAKAQQATPVRKDRPVGSTSPKPNMPTRDKKIGQMSPSDYIEQKYGPIF